MNKSLFLLFALIIALVLCITACSHTHDFDEWITTKQATCTQNGEMVRYCSCGEKQTEVVVANGAHIEVVDAAVAPTCTKEGLTEGKHCAICNEIFLAQTVVQKLEHTLDADGVCALCDQPIIPTEGIAYEKSEDGTYAMVVGYDGTASKIRIADIYEGLPVTHINENAFYNEVITSVVIPDSVTYIGNTAFGGCTNITSIMIPDSVTDIGYAPFVACNNLVSIEVNENNVHYKSINGHLCTKDEKTLIQYAGGNPDINAVIPDGVTTIGYGAFAYCTNIYTINIPDSVTNIGDYAFAYCSSLTLIEVDENNKYYKSIDGNLYTNDGKTLIQYATRKTEKNFAIPDSVTTIGDDAFWNCSSLTSVVIPDSVTTIGNSAFSWCSSLTSVVIGDSVTTIGDRAFQSCSSLTDVYYTGSEEEWGGIAIGLENYDLTGATKHYNYVPEE